MVPLAGCQRGGVSVPSVAAAGSTVATTGPATIVIEPRVLHANVERLGINLSGQTFYDSGQMLRNLAFRNPGFEGEAWQSILHCKWTTASSCTDENQYAQWPAGFLDGARYELISGTGRGATGLVRASMAASGGRGVTLQFSDTPRGFAAGDFVLVRALKPGGADAGWWKDLKGGATLSTELHDLSPHSPGLQALRVDASAAASAATVSSFFDSFEGHSFVQLRGRYQLSFRARGLTPGAVLAVSVKRLDTTHGLHSFLERNVPLTPAWHDYTFTFDAAEDGSAIGTVGVSFGLEHAAMLLDDVALVAAAGSNNPTAFRSEVVEALRTLHPGVLRYMDNGTDFGSSLDNMLAPPFARQRTGASTQETLHEDIPLGLEEFLTLCAAVGADPWYSMPPGTSPQEARQLIEYLAGPLTTPYGAKRAALGRREPWTTAFHTIHLELGNEQWNARSFAGSTINDPTAFGRRAGEIYTAMRAVPGFQPQAFDLIMGSWATVPWWTGQELSASSGVDSVAVAPYLFSEFNDASSNEAIFAPMFAEPEMVDAPAGYMGQQRAALDRAGHARLAVYEVNLGTMSGAVSQTAIDRAVPSLGAGLAVADHMLLMLRDLGVTTQCLFALPEYVNQFDATGGGSGKTMPLWGAVVDMGGATSQRRPQFLAEQLANSAILPDMLATRVEGTPQTWDQPPSRNAGVQLKGAHLLQTFAFAQGAARSLILLNLSRDRALPVRFSGAESPAGKIEESRLTAAEITASNEHQPQVATVKRSLPAFDASQAYLLPPFSMTVLTWQAGAAGRGR